MQVLEMVEPGRIAVVDRQRPRPASEDALIRVDAVGICGSDIHGFAGETGRRPPGIVMGHELGGTIVQCDSRPELVGSTVTAFPVLSCGSCRYCAAGREQLCPRAEIIGVSPALQGAFAEYVVVPVANVVPMPATEPLVAGLVEPLAVGLHAAQLAGDLTGRSILVVGAGTIGLCVITACRKLGAAAVYATDLATDREALARSFGARTPAADSPDVPEWLRGEHGLVDVVIDAVGSTSSLGTSLAAAKPGGTVVVVGMGEPRVELALYGIVTHERSVIGSFCYGRSAFDLAATWLIDGVDGLEDLVSAVVDLDGAQEALTSLADGSDRSPRVMISPSGRYSTHRARRAPE